MSSRYKRPARCLRAIQLAVILGCAAGGQSPAEERKQKAGEEELEEELGELKDADYPDLVSADEEGGIIDEFALLAEEDVVESAARHRQEIGMSPSAITVITREDIEASGASFLPDLLRLVPGMDVIVNSVTLPAVSARVYWTNENNVFLVLVDGREANIELLGSPPWEIQPISLDDIERIEIIRGPGSSLYGANALAGVISITTRAVPQATSGWARLAVGEAGLLVGGARASTAIGDWGFSLGAEGNLVGRFTDPRDRMMDTWKLRLLVERRLSEQSRLYLEAGIAQGSGPVTSGAGTINIDLNLQTIRAGYESEALRAQLYWSHTPVVVDFRAPLDFQSVRLAYFIPAEINAQTVDGEVSWKLPELWSPLLLIVGGGGRFSYVGSDHLLDAQTFADRTSPRYHQVGVEHTEWRAGAYLHGELAPTDWVTVTGGARLDYNTETDVFLSPRLAAVFRPAARHFIRVGVARAFRKPAYAETGLHVMAEFPDESPIKGQDQDRFLEFMTRVVGNDALDNEELVSAELGYLGYFLDDDLSLSVDLYYTQYLNIANVVSRIEIDEQGLPDLDASSMMQENAMDLDTLGGELVVRYRPSRRVMLLFSWAHRQVFEHDTGRYFPNNPKNLLALGGRFSTGFGLLGSLYAFSRSEFVDYTVENPAGILEPYLIQHMDNVLLLLGKVGWRWERGSILLETGLKLFLPIAPFSHPHFRYYEKGGGVTLQGVRYGGEELARMLTVYLQGSF